MRSLTISKCPRSHTKWNPVDWEKKQENRRKKKKKKKGKNKRNKTKKKESEFQHNPSPNKNKKPQKDPSWFWHWYQRLVLIRGIQPLQYVPYNKPSGRVSIHTKYISKYLWKEKRISSYHDLFFKSQILFHQKMKNEKNSKKEKHTSSGDLTSNPSSFMRSLAVSKCPSLHTILNPVDWEKKQENRRKKKKKKKKEKIRETIQRKKSQNFSTIPLQTKIKNPRSVMIILPHIGGSGIDINALF